MLGITKLRQKIAVLSVFVLLLSVVKIVYEFHTAQSAIDQADRTDISFPSLSHLSAHPAHSPPLLPVTGADLGTKPSPHSTLLPTVPMEQESHVASADKKINGGNARYFRHAQQGPAPTSPVVSRAVSRLPSRSSSGSTMMNTQPVLVIVVCSKPENTELRLALRRSWGLELDDSKVILRFFVGRNDDWDKIIAREQDLHGDVVRTDYIDSYENLSYKVLTALSWALHNVRSAQYVMKIDDDTYVNLPYLLSELRSRRGTADLTRHYVMGAVCVNSSVVRDEGDKWFVSHLDYPSDVYPTYMFGGGYVMTKGAAESIMAASVKTDYLHLEDVFITGILAKAAGVDHVAHPGFVFWTSRRPSPCDIVTGRRLTAVSLTYKQIYVMYSAIHAILRTGNWTSC